MRRLGVWGILFALTAACASAASLRLPFAAKHAFSKRKKAPAQLHLKRHPLVALTFDDLPAGGDLHVGETRAEIAKRLVNELKAAHLKGVYGFVNGTGVAEDPDLQAALHIWLNAGMEIGNHTWSHPALDQSTAESYIHNIAINESTLQEYEPLSNWHWFRYPYLEEGNTLSKRDAVRNWLFDHSYRIAQVTLNFQDDDWDDPYGRCLAKHDEAGIAWLKQSYMENAVEFIRVGREEEKIAFGHEVPNVLLLHETDFTTLMLPSLIKLLRSEGFRFAPLAKIERNRVYAMNPNFGDPGGGTLPDQFMDVRHLKYPAFRPEPVQKLNSLCQ